MNDLNTIQSDILILVPSWLKTILQIDVRRALSQQICINALRIFDKKGHDICTFLCARCIVEGISVPMHLRALRVHLESKCVLDSFLINLYQSYHLDTRSHCVQWRISKFATRSISANDC